MDIQAQDGKNYQVNFYLDNNQDDYFRVEVFPPSISSKKAAYIFRPTGSSGFANIPIGEYIRDVRAYDEEGKELNVTQFDQTQFLIKPSQDLYRITYQVWEPDETFQRDFHPHGLMVRNKELYLINFHLALGYMNNFIYKSYKVNIHHEGGKEVREDMTYTQLENHTMFLGKLRESSFEVNGIPYEIKVYSEDDTHSTSHLHKQVQEIVKDALDAIGHKRAQHQKFNIIIKDDKSRAGFGGSVHGDAYTFVLPNTKNKQVFRQRLNHVLMHEVLHTLTPFQLHSHITDLEHRSQFEYSEHLWLYEGITEYLALSILLRSKRIDEKDMRRQLSKKYNRAKSFPPAAMTDVSLNRGKERYAPMVDNVYYKGALIGFVLDMEIYRLSNGQWTLLDALKTLNNSYNYDTPFQEDELIDELSKITEIDLNPFYKRFIASDQMIDINKFIPLIGWEFLEEKEYEELSFGAFKLKSDEVAHAFYFEKVGENNLRVQERDILRAMDGEEINSENYHKAITDLLDPQRGEVIAIQVERDGKLVQLQGIPKASTYSIKNNIHEIDTATEEQLEFRRAFLFGKN